MRTCCPATNQGEAIMPEQPRSERKTQNRFIALFTDKTRALKQAMMQELLTGRTRLVSREAAKNAKEQK